MFDTHCHLNFSRFKKRLYDVVGSAREKGVTHFLIPGIDVGSSKRAIEVSKEIKFAFVACGIHPNSNLEQLDLEKALYHIEELCLKTDKVVAIGEIGLDYYPASFEKKGLNKTIPSTQKLFFKEQIRLAIKLDKSVIIHNRKASGDLILIL